MVNKVNIINYFYKNKSNIFLAILLIVIINILLKSDILYDFIWGGENLFGDYKLNISWLKWNYLGLDVFQDHNGFRKMSYAPIFLLVPFNLKLETFYLNCLPYITIALLLFSITFLINPKNKIEYTILFLSIFNPSTLLLIERMNFDIFIFLITIFIIFNRVYFINWILIFFLGLVKFYPAILGINIMLENKNRKILMLIFIILGIFLSSILYLYFNYEKYQIIFETTSFKAGYHYLFSLKTIPKILKYLFHCINFLHVAEELYSSVKVKDSEIKFKDEKLKHVNSLKELLDYHMEIYSKNNNRIYKFEFFWCLNYICCFFCCI